MTPAFFPFPYPVVTPLGEGYAVYITPSPMFENDTWCVQLDDGRILHFATNQLRGVANRTFGIEPVAENRTRVWFHTNAGEPESREASPAARPVAGVVVTHRRNTQRRESACGVQLLCASTLWSVVAADVTCPACLVGCVCPPGDVHACTCPSPPPP